MVISVCLQLKSIHPIFQKFYKSACRIKFVPLIFSSNTQEVVTQCLVELEPKSSCLLKRQWRSSKSTNNESNKKGLTRPFQSTHWRDRIVDRLDNREILVSLEGEICKSHSRTPPLLWRRGRCLVLFPPTVGFTWFTGLPKVAPLLSCHFKY